MENSCTLYRNTKLNRNSRLNENLFSRQTRKIRLKCYTKIGKRALKNCPSQPKRLDVPLSPEASRRDDTAEGKKCLGCSRSRRTYYWNAAFEGRQRQIFNKRFFCHRRNFRRLFERNNASDGWREREFFQWYDLFNIHHMIPIKLSDDYVLRFYKRILFIGIQVENFNAAFYYNVCVLAII